MVHRTNLFSRLLILVLAATMPALLVLFILQQNLRDDREARIPEEAQQQAELINADLRSVMEGARQLGAALARFSSVRNLDPACARHMREVRADLPSYAVISVRDAAGQLVCSSNPALASDGVIETCVADDMQPGALRVGLFTAGAAAAGPVLPLCVTFGARGGRLGHVVMELSLAWLAEHVAELRLPARSTVGIADREGFTLVRVPDHGAHVGKKLPAGVLPLVTGLRLDSARVVGVDGQERVVGYVPPSAAGQGVFVSIGLFAPDLLADLDDAARNGSMLMGLVVVLSLGLAMLAGERFVHRPTVALLDAAQRWSQGELKARARLAEPAGSAFGMLATAFNNMAETLGRRRAELEELNATLEARVHERTRDLEDSRNRLQKEIAERERTEAELHQAQKLQAVGQLAGGIAHDFNNLLTAIVGALDLIRRRLQPAQPQILPLVESALHAAERGGRLTTQLLAFSRRQRLLPSPTNLNVPVLALTGLLGSTLGRNIRIETNLVADLWLAMVDPTQVEAMILNLAINARDAMPEGGVLTIRTRNHSVSGGAGGRGNVVAGDYVALEVHDTGIGIPQDLLDRVFEPFFTTKKLGEGAGLGLSQVHGLALQSGGDVRIESGPGQGTRVTVLLPRAAVVVVPVQGQPDEMAATRPRPLRVLVVDDDRAVREMTCEMLAERGHAVVQAEDARQALDQLQRTRDEAAERFDLMLADYVMPGMNGVALIRAAREIVPGLPALLVTGHAEFEASELMRPEDVMRKPFTIAHLEERVARVIEGAQALS